MKMLRPCCFPWMIGRDLNNMDISHLSAQSKSHQYLCTSSARFACFDSLPSQSLAATSISAHPPHRWSLPVGQQHPHHEGQLWIESQVDLLCPCHRWTLLRYSHLRAKSLKQKDDVYSQVDPIWPLLRCPCHHWSFLSLSFRWAKSSKENDDVYEAQVRWMDRPVYRRTKRRTSEIESKDCSTSSRARLDVPYSTSLTSRQRRKSSVNQVNPLHTGMGWIELEHEKARKLRGIGVQVTSDIRYRGHATLTKGAIVKRDSAAK